MIVSIHLQNRGVHKEKRCGIQETMGSSLAKKSKSQSPAFHSTGLERKRQDSRMRISGGIKEQYRQYDWASRKIEYDKVTKSRNKDRQWVISGKKKSKLRCDTILGNRKMVFLKKKIHLKLLLETIFVSVVNKHTFIEAVHALRKLASDVEAWRSLQDRQWGRGDKNSSGE